jgi:hypothetical protein
MADGGRLATLFRGSIIARLAARHNCRLGEPVPYNSRPPPWRGPAYLEPIGSLSKE